MSDSGRETSVADVVFTLLSMAGSLPRLARTLCWMFQPDQASKDTLEDSAHSLGSEHLVTLYLLPTAFFTNFC